MATDYNYDLNNNLTSVSQGSQTRTFAYDMLSRLTSATNPESGTTTYVYDQNTSCASPNSFPGQLVSKTDARSIRTCMQYDGLNRLTQKNYSDGTATVSYSYDQSSYNGLTITNGKTRRTGMSDGSGTTAWSYDSVGNIVTEKRTIGSVTNSITYYYNLDSSLWKITYPSGRTITYAPGGAQRPLSGVDTSNSINYATSAHYAPQGALASVQNGSSLASALYYNNRLQPCRISANNNGAGPSACASTTAGNVVDLTYGFGAGNNGNVMWIMNNRDTTRTQTFTYDALNRIATAAAATHAESSNNCWGESFGYDQYGNLTSIGAMSSAYNSCIQDNLNVSASTGTNRLSTGTTPNFTYDASGNMTSDTVNSYTYDAENRICSVGGTSCSTGTTYTYDGDGNRVKKSGGMLYWYDTSNNPLAESDLSGSFTSEYVFLNGTRIGRRIVSSGAVEYYFADQLGTSRVVTDSSGALLDDCDFFPFGGHAANCFITSENRYQFTGKERDSESGLDDFGARYDSSQYGRFMTPDPLLNSGHPWDPQSWNRYAYALNNPLNVTDPTGLYNLINNCDSDDTKCNKQFNQEAQNLKNGVTALTNAVNKLKDGDQKTALQGALKAFGTENDGNNVGVQFGKNADGAAANTSLSVDSSGTNLSFTVTFDPNQNQGMFNQAISAAHEGTHIADESDPRFADSATTLSPFSLEYRGYRTSAYAASALGLPSISYGRNGQYPIWNGSWGAVDRNLTNYITTFRDKNGQPDHPETKPHDPWSK